MADSIKKRESVSTSGGHRDGVSPLPWRVICGHVLRDADDMPVATAWREADAAFIVEAVNANEAWREEGRRLQLAAASAEKAFDDADARRTLLERYYCEVCAERDRLRELVRRLAEYIQHSVYDGDGPLEIDITSSSTNGNYYGNANNLLREARAVLGEGEP